MRYGRRGSELDSVNELFRRRLHVDAGGRQSAVAEQGSEPYQVVGMGCQIPSGKGMPPRMRPQPSDAVTRGRIGRSISTRNDLECVSVRKIP